MLCLGMQLVKEVIFFLPGVFLDDLVGHLQPLLFNSLHLASLVIIINLKEGVIEEFFALGMTGINRLSVNPSIRII